MTSFFITFIRFGRAIRQGFKDEDFRGLFIFLLAVLLSGTIFYHVVEGWPVLDALYFSVTTLTTVGLGDLTPVTSIGKIFTILYIIAGIGTMFAFINAIAQHTRKRTLIHEIIDYQKKPTEEKKEVDEKNPLPKPRRIIS